MKRPFLEVVASEPDLELERVFAAARELAEPAAENRARVLSAVHAALPGSAPSGVQLRASAVLREPPAPQRAAPLGVKWLALGGAVLAALSFSLGHVVGHARGLAESARGEPGAEAGPLRPKATEAARAPEGAGPPGASHPPRRSPAPRGASGASDATEVSVRSPLPPRRSTRAEPRRAPAAPPPSEVAAGLGFREVLDQLRRAQEQLRLGQATMSLLLLSELDRRAGDVLLEERETTRVLALCASGQEVAARAAARALRARSPRSIYAQRLLASCATEEGGD